MKRVFVSYSSKDEAVARLVVRWLEEHELTPLWWQDPMTRGRRVISEIEKDIAEADLFLVLLSEDYLVSPWCRHERDLALHREMDLGGRSAGFIAVLQVGDAPTRDTGFLRVYDRLDAQPPLDAEKLQSIATSLGLGAASPPERPASPPAAPIPSFRNRVDELRMLEQALTTTGGRHFWAVSSPPRMGKSWLLNRLQRELSSGGRNGWVVRSIDLRDQPRALRRDTAAALGALFGTTVDEAPGADDMPGDRALGRVASAVSERRRKQLYVLDSADLMEPAVARRLRDALATISRQVIRAGRSDTRLAIVVGTRRSDEWRGLGRRSGPGSRVELLALTEFRDHVVHEALVELDAQLDRHPGAEHQWLCAHRLHRLSEGLPALLVRSLRLATPDDFLNMDESDLDVAFEEVARPYVRDDLLSEECLLPHGGHRATDEMAVLLRALRILSAYRIFTISHLHHHLDTDLELRELLEAVGWGEADLWGALARTSLGHPVRECWQELEPSIRRLLYRYFHRAEREQLESHKAARVFYEGWTSGQKAGKEQGVVLVECIWHEAAAMMIERPDDVVRLLPDAAAALARQFAGSPLYRPAEVSPFVAARMTDDEELRMLLRPHERLFDAVLDAVLREIDGTGEIGGAG